MAVNGQKERADGAVQTPKGGEKADLSAQECGRIIRSEAFPKLNEQLDDVRRPSYVHKQQRIFTEINLLLIAAVPIIAIAHVYISLYGIRL